MFPLKSERHALLFHTQGYGCSADHTVAKFSEFSAAECSIQWPSFSTRTGSSLVSCGLYSFRGHFRSVVHVQFFAFVCLWLIFMSLWIFASPSRGFPPSQQLDLPHQPESIMSSGVICFNNSLLIIFLCCVASLQHVRKTNCRFLVFEIYLRWWIVCSFVLHSGCGWHWFELCENAYQNLFSVLKNLFRVLWPVGRKL